MNWGDVRARVWTPTLRRKEKSQPGVDARSSEKRETFITKRLWWDGNKTPKWMSFTLPATIGIEVGSSE